MIRPCDRWLTVAVALLLSGCINLAPRYQRPAALVEQSWPSVDGKAATGGGVSTGAEASADGGAASTASNGASAAEMGWRDFFKDPRLQRVIAQALANNRDLRVAVLNIEKARAQYRIRRAELFPSISATGTSTASRTPASVSGTGQAVIGHTDSVELGFSSYELDLFGRVRNLEDQALEGYLSTAETRRSTQISLMAEVASDWLTLASDKALLELARQTLQSQQSTYNLVIAEHQLGATSGLDLAQARGSVESARKEVASYLTQVAQDRNALNLVVGATVAEDDLPDASLEALVTLAELPAGLPSQVLLRRPDVLSAEHTLKSAHADIGAARAAFFPSITLTGSAGAQSAGLSGLFKAGSGAWSFSPSISLPIFNAGSNRASLDEAKASRDIDLAIYEKTVQNAFKEVADVLATRDTIGQQLDAERAQLQAEQRSYDLSSALYRHGSESMLDLLTVQRTLYGAQQSLISGQLSDQTSLVTLYKVLGGGWYEHTGDVARTFPTDAPK